MSTVMILALEAISTDPDLQPRHTMSSNVIKDYAALYTEGQPLAPIVVFQDGIDYWLADGFHRLEAARLAGRTELPADVYQGTRRDALFYSCGANKHGKTRTNDDKRRQVMRLLDDEEWSSRMKNTDISQHCGVHQSFVAKLRKELSHEKTVSSFDNQKMKNVSQDSTSLAEPVSASIPIPEQEESTLDDAPDDDLSRADIEAMFTPPDPAPGSSPGQALEAHPGATEALEVPSEAPLTTLTIPLRLVSSAPPVPKGQGRSTFNRTNEMVDWAKWTWNPVTGCLHNCDYCYARRIAERFYPEKFAPTFRPERLKAPHYTPVPPEADTEIGYRNVFVCSMADLFGKWIPDEWIEAVLTEVRATPQWNFLFLTKFPQRLASIAWPQNAWVGTTVDEQYRVEIAEKAFRQVDASVTWLSCEPLRERLTFSSLTMFDWVVLGGQTAQTGDDPCPAFQPPWEWVKHLLRQADEAGCMVYWKPNLLTRPQEYPGRRTLGVPLYKPGRRPSRHAMLPRLHHGTALVHESPR